MLLKVAQSLMELYKSWGIVQSHLPAFDLFVDPAKIKYKKKIENLDENNFGSYTLNPEISGYDFEKEKSSFLTYQKSKIKNSIKYFSML